jgi:hypothetical protein
MGELGSNHGTLSVGHGAEVNEMLRYDGIKQTDCLLSVHLSVAVRLLRSLLDTTHLSSDGSWHGLIKQLLSPSLPPFPSELTLSCSATNVAEALEVAEKVQNINPSPSIIITVSPFSSCDRLDILF